MPALPCSSRNAGFAARGISEGQLININEECGCDEKDDNVPEEVMLTKNFTLKEL